ncbi:MAG: electron transport complex subunit RsxA [Lachnospiraceae bacterium]|nr:electron transport complex subunit RsxA [Lachnospiraceae bacterium]
MMTLILLAISSALISNVVLSNFLGICPFLGVSNKVETAKGMGLAVIFVICLATLVTYGINEAFLRTTGIFHKDLTYLQTIVFILVIACLVQFVEMVLKKYMVGLYKALGVYLPLITTNCAVLGVALTVVQDYDTYPNLAYALVYAFGTSFGFVLAICWLASIRERIENNDIPESFKGKPIVLVTACLMAIAFFGFASIEMG